jgi:isocitrate/isopropylmalate dehydrogenase
MSPIAVQRKYSIATMGADGIGPEVVNAGVQVLKKLAQLDGTFELDFKDYDWSSETYKKTGKYIPDGGLDELKKHDAILFGAVGAPDVPDHISLWGLRLAICQPFQQYANVRPTKIFRGTTSPLRNVKEGDLDWVIVRENSEGEYSGQGGRSHRGLPWEIATDVSIFTRHCVERLIRFAFEIAQKRPRKLLTVVTKSNAQRNGMVMWDEVAAEVAKDFPDVKCDKAIVDAMTCRMVLDPKSLDTIVATNLVCFSRCSVESVVLSDIARGYSLRPCRWTGRFNWNCADKVSIQLYDQVSRLTSPAILTQHARIRPCLSRSTARPLTLPVRVLPILSARFGQRLKC